MYLCGVNSLCGGNFSIFVRLSRRCGGKLRRCVGNFSIISRGWVSLGCPPELGRDDKTSQNETRRNNADDDDNDDEEGWG